MDVSVFVSVLFFHVYLARKQIVEWFIANNHTEKKTNFNVFRYTSKIKGIKKIWGTASGATHREIMNKSHFRIRVHSQQRLDKITCEPYGGLATRTSK